MPEQETAGRQPGWALMYALHDTLRRDLGALLAACANPAAVRTSGPSSATGAGSSTPPRNQGRSGSRVHQPTQTRSR